MKARQIHSEILIRTTPERMWEVLSHYGDVSTFHAGVVESHRLDGSGNRAAPGCERVCNIVDMGLEITLKERIVDYQEGRGYRYEVYEWKNFPIRHMSFGFTILGHTLSHTTLAVDMEYLAKPAFLTPLLAGKMRRLARDVLLGYRHFTETGEQRVPIKQLKRHFRRTDPLAVRFG